MTFNAPVFGMRVELDGPFFTRDTTATVRENIRGMLEALVSQGEAEVQSHFPVDTGAGKAGVIGRVESMSGKHWALHGVISEQHIYPWGVHSALVRSRGKFVIGTGHEGYRGGKLERKLHMFGDAARALYGMRAVLSADLSRGLE